MAETDTVSERDIRYINSELQAHEERANLHRRLKSKMNTRNQRLSHSQTPRCIPLNGRIGQVP